MNILIVKPLVDRLYDPNDVSISMYGPFVPRPFICSNILATEGFNKLLVLPLTKDFFIEPLGDTMETVTYTSRTPQHIRLLLVF